MTHNISYKTVDFDPFRDNEFLFTVSTTEAQQEIFASIIMDESSSCAFNESLSVTLKGPLNKSALKQAIHAVIIRHDALRSTFSPDASVFMVAAKAICDVLELDLSKEDQEQQQKQLQKLAKAEVNQAFDLCNGPLIRFKIIQLQAAEHILILTAHHIVCDGWSIAVLIEDIGNFYNAVLQETTAQLAPVYPFSRYAKLKENEKNSPEYLDSESYWKALFMGKESLAIDPIPILDLPNDYPRPAQRTYHSERIDYELPIDYIKQLTKVGAKQSCSLVNTMFACFKLLIYSLTKQESLVIGMPAAEQSILGEYDLIGHCVNMLPIKTTIQPADQFNDFLLQVKRNMLDAYEHQNYTYGSLLKQLPIKRDPSRIPLLPITFNIDQKIESEDFHWQDLQVDYHSNPRSFENFELFINASKGDGKFILEAQYNSDLFKAETIIAWFKQFESLLANICKNPQQTIQQLCLSSNEKQTSILKKMNATTQPYPCSQGIHEIIHQQAISRGEKIAIVDEKEQISYADLDIQSSQLAHLLINKGVHPHNPIGLCMDRSIQMVLGLIAIWKAGCAYVPLDPNYPADRLKYMIDNSGMSFVLSESSSEEHLPETDAKTICIDREKVPIQRMPRSAPELSNFSSSHSAYIIYTSGSTGNPKGVMITHKNVSNFLHSMARRPGLEEHDKLLAVTTISFDIAVLELYLPLIVGAQVVLATRETAIDGDKLIAYIEQYQISCLQATPMTWRLMLACAWQGNKNLKALCGGEPFPADLAQSLFGKVKSLWNMYGPTETTVWSSCHEITNPNEALYIGQPIANTQVYILDDDLNPLGPNKIGKLFIAGDGLATAYWGAEDLTQQKFIQHSSLLHGFSQQEESQPGNSQELTQELTQRMYDTGDLGRYNNQGLLECLGRNDSQIKLRGFRIELGEIQSVIARHDSVAQCVIRLVDLDADQSICAYVILHENQPLSHAEMRQFARKKLPEYMIPSHLVIMSDFPKTLNGKIDAKALPLPAENKPSVQKFSDADKNSASSSAGSTVCDSQAEIILMDIFKDVLAINELTVDDNFFELGGHSLLSLKVIQQIKKICPNKITPRMMLTDTIAQLAFHCEIAEERQDKTPHGENISPSAPEPTRTQNNATQNQAFFFPAQAQDNSSQEQKKRLFGLYYPPLVDTARDTGVLLLYPIAQEYMRCHWGIKHMAKLLAKQGFHVFKFDYYGTGDSSGQSEQFSIAQCLNDIQLAEQEFKQRSGVNNISIVGLRLGATLAAIYANQAYISQDKPSQSKLSQLILWDPVVSGSSHLKELGSLQQQLLIRIKENNAFFSGFNKQQKDPPDELLGYPLGESLYQEIQDLNLLQLTFDKQQRTILISSQENPEITQLKDYLLNHCSNFSYNHVRDNINWSDLDQYLNSIIPHKTMNQIINALAGVNHV